METALDIVAKALAGRIFRGDSFEYGFSFYRSDKDERNSPHAFILTGKVKYRHSIVPNIPDITPSFLFAYDLTSGKETFICSSDIIYLFHISPRNKLTPDEAENLAYYEQSQLEQKASAQTTP